MLKENESTDTHALLIVHICGSCKISIPSFLNSGDIDESDLHILQFKINIVIFSRFLHFKFSKQPRANG